MPLRSTSSPAACLPWSVVGDLNGDFETSEFFVTCLNELLVRLGPPSERDTGSGEPAERFGEGFNGEREVESRLLICKGDQPLAEEFMIEFLAALAAEGEPAKLSRFEVGVGRAYPCPEPVPEGVMGCGLGDNDIMFGGGY